MLFHDCSVPQNWQLQRSKFSAMHLTYIFHLFNLICMASHLNVMCIEVQYNERVSVGEENKDRQLTTNHAVHSRFFSSFQLQARAEHNKQLSCVIVHSGY